MKKVLFGIVCMFAVSSIQAQSETKEFSSLMNEVNLLQSNYTRLKSDVTILKNNNKNAVSRISVLESVNKELNTKLDSLQDAYDKLVVSQKTDKSELSTIIGETNDKIKATEAILSSRTLWGICGIIALIIALAAIVWAFLKKIKSGTTSIDNIRKAQSSL